MSIKVVQTIQKKTPLLLTGFFLTILVAVLCHMRPAFLDYMVFKIYDIQMQNYHKEKQSGSLVVIDIDDETLKENGQWPWPRYRVSELFEKIKQAGVVSLGVDILFAEPDRTSLSNIDKSMKSYYMDRLGQDQSVISDTLPGSVLDNDKILAQTLAKGGFVLGYTFNSSGDQLGYDVKGVKPLNALIVSAKGVKDKYRYMLNPSGLIPPLKVLTDSGKDTGFFNTTPEYDGILRATPLIISYNERIYPSLSLATLLVARNNPQVVLSIDKQGVNNIKIGDSTIPLDEKGKFYIHYRGGGTPFENIPASKFLNNEIAPGSLAGKIGFLGTSAAGLKDLKNTPLDPEFMGSQVHATIVDNILQNDYITWPAWFRGAEVIMVLLFGIFITSAIVWARPFMTIAFVIVVSIGLWKFSVFAFCEKQMFLSPLYSYISLGLNFSLLSLLKYYVSEKDRLFLKKAFSSYVSDDLIEDIVKDPEMLKLGGHIRAASVLFCDLKNFTNISENRSPHEIVNIMSTYFEDMTGYVFKHKGTLKDYIGDELMAIFGAPLSAEDHAVNACRAALDMQAFLKRLRHGGYRGSLPPLSARIGVNTGEMLIGNIGSKYRFSYGALGDNVNLGSRLEGLNKIYGTEIIIGQRTAAVVKEFYHLRHLGAVQVKGKKIAEKVYELIGDKKIPLEENHKKSLEFYETGYQYYKDQKWTKAIDCFEKGKALFSRDISFDVMIQRCSLYKTMPYIENFDGTFMERRK